MIPLINSQFWAAHLPVKRVLRMRFIVILLRISCFGHRCIKLNLILNYPLTYKCANKKNKNLRNSSLWTF